MSVSLALCTVAIEHSFLCFYPDVCAAAAIAVVDVVKCTPPHSVVSMKLNCHYAFDSGGGVWRW